MAPAKLQENLLARYWVRTLQVAEQPAIREEVLALAGALHQTYHARDVVEILRVFFKYLTSRSDYVDTELIQQTTEPIPDRREALMATLAEQWEKRGEQRGRAEAKTEGYQKWLIRYLQRQFGPLDEQTIQGIQSIQTPEILEALFDEAMDANTLEAFLQQLNRVVSHHKD